MPIIYRPDYLGDAVANALSNESVKQQREHEEELAKRKKRQRNTAIGVGAGLGAIGGFALAPAAVASAGAGSGFAAGTALTAAGTPALAGAIVPTLTGAALGGQIGGQLAAEDYVGALGTAAGAAKLGVEYADNERIYGYQPTAAGRASLAALAAKAGTTIDQVEAESRRTGVPVAQILSGAQGTADDREIGEQYYQTLARQAAMDDATGLRLSAEDELDRLPGYAPVPDDGAIQSAQVGPGSLASIDADAALYRESGGTDGASYAEMRGSLARVGRDIRTGARGRRQPQTPPNISINPDGTTTEVPWGKPYYEDLTTLMVPRRDAKGQVNYFPKTIDPIATIGKLPESQQPAAIKRYKRLYGAEPGEEDQYKLKTGGGIEEKKSQEAEDRRKLINDLVTTAAKNGETLDAATLATSVEAVAGVDQIIADRKQLAQSVVGFAESMGNQSIPVQASDAINAKIVEVFGGDPNTWPLNVRTAATAIAEKAKADTAVAGLAMAAQVAANAPPPGSAASAEEVGRMAGAAARKLPGKAVEAGVKAGAVAVGAASTAGRAGGGFLEGLLGMKPDPTYGELFEKVQQRNIEAGLDDQVMLLKLDGSTLWQRKGDLNPEHAAKLKAQGWTIPGLD